MRAEAQWFRRRYQSDNFGSWETDENVLWANWNKWWELKVSKRRTKKSLLHNFMLPKNLLLLTSLPKQINKCFQKLQRK